MIEEKTKNIKKRGLGRGLSALIPDGIEDNILFDKNNENRIQEIDINKIKPNSLQPRRTFDERELESLSNSIKRNGVIQAIVIRQVGEYYEIIAGERRWRASMMAKLKTIPAIVMDLSEEQRYEVSLVENLQRSDLNPIEEALAYSTLIEKFSMTQEKVAEVVGKSRAYVTNTLRLLKLSDIVQNDIIEGSISAGHAKMLVTFSEKRQKELSKKIQSENLSVRELENLVSQENSKKSNKKKSEKLLKSDDEYLDIIENLSEKFGTKVAIEEKNKKGKIIFEFYDREDFERLYKIMKK